LFDLSCSIDALSISRDVIASDKPYTLDRVIVWDASNYVFLYVFLPGLCQPDHWANVLLDDEEAGEDVTLDCRMEVL
jgi:hypothetical protein